VPLSLGGALERNELTLGPARLALRPSGVSFWAMNKPGVAGVLSLVLPGVGQIYNGEYLRGIFWLIITPGFWIGTGGTLGWVCHVASSYTAFRRAQPA